MTASSPRPQLDLYSTEASPAAPKEERGILRPRFEMIRQLRTVEGAVPPHPGPLPWGEGESSAVHGSNAHFSNVDALHEPTVRKFGATPLGL
jgi:hypothetical protein